MYSVGDKVVCPSHGAGRVVGIEQREVLGRSREYLTVRMLHDHMTVMIPAEHAERRLRKVITADAVDDVVEVLRTGRATMPEKWLARSRHIHDKLGTGDIFDVADVVRDLALRHAVKGLPLGEKQALNKARKILAGELMYARDLSEEDVEKLLEDILERSRL
jgi:CarD family transcriptional regulator